MVPESQRGRSQPQNQLINAAGQTQTRLEAVGLVSCFPEPVVMHHLLLLPCGHVFTWSATHSSSHPLRVECLPGGP